MIHLIPPPNTAAPLRTDPPSQLGEDWQSALRGSLRSLNELLAGGWITQRERDQLHSLKIETRTKIRIPEYYASLMDPKDPSCPIRLQALPSLMEMDPELPEFVKRWSQEIYHRDSLWTPDPIGDLDRLSAPRLTHRYRNRALLHLSSSCAMYCRFCFRKEHLGNAEKDLYSGSLDPALHYLKAHPEIRELILTGGDPLSLSDTLLEGTLTKLAEAAPQIRVLRFHSRMAVTLPIRLTPQLADLFGRDWPFQIHFVSHFNHPRELTPLALQGLKRLAKKGIPLWNQNVLLRTVNDCPETLTTLYQGLYEWGVAPFYLHHADLTPGTFGFRTTIEKGRSLMRSLKGRLPGPALPDYVLDVPGGMGKVSLMDTERVKRSPDFIPPQEWKFSPAESSLLRTQHGSAEVYEIAPSETRQRSGSALIRYLDLAPLDS